MQILLRIDDIRRIRVYKEGGLDLETHVKGIGWVLDNEADIADHVIDSYIFEARKILDKVKTLT